MKFELTASMMCADYGYLEQEVKNRGCKFFCVYGGRILPIRFRYVPSSVELID